ncbi:MAG TPA: aminopeptidase P family protein [Alphaproteobacteria bacterium]|nr:aminopeptidase P family protein [Alphaproteobacteria bacterium]
MADSSFSRLSELRAALAAQKLDGFFVPLADEYMNEYVPEGAQRLAWLTGFTGSAGLALVLKDRAVLFVDGRYTLQAAKQVDASLFEVRHISKAPLSDYIRQNVKAGQHLGYDAWLHTAPWLERVEEAAKAVNAKLIAVSANPVDSIWKNRPAAPCAPVFAHPMEYAGESSNDKRARLGKQLKEKGVDAAILTNPASVAWLLNVRGGDVEGTPLPLSYAILHASGRVDWFIHPAKVSAELKKTLGADVAAYPQEEFVKSLRQLGGKGLKCRVNASSAPVAVLNALKDSGAQVDRGEDPCELPKACKNKTEIEGMKAAHRRDGLALTKFLCWLDAQAGKVDELAAEEKLLEFRKANNSFLYPSFHSISGAGPNGAVVHYRASKETNRRLGKGEFYLIDSGGQYPDGTTDVTRTVAIGDVSAEMRQNFTRVLKGHIALARACFPAGAAGAQLDVLARQYLWQAGLDYDHGTGHGVGAFLGVHEGPQNISSRSQVPLQAGMVISNEPGYYQAGAYGIRIENLVTVKESAKKLDEKPMLEFETLTLAPIDLRAVDVSMLNADEKTWLNTYHRAVFDAHASAMNAEERKWLEAATKPL